MTPQRQCNICQVPLRDGEDGTCDPCVHGERPCERSRERYPLKDAFCWECGAIMSVYEWDKQHPQDVRCEYCGKDEA